MRAKRMKKRIKVEPARKGRPTIETSKALEGGANELVAYGSYGNRAADPRWLDAVQCAQMIRQIARASFDERSAGAKRAQLLSLGAIRLAVEKISREVRAGRGPDFFENVAAALRAGLDDAGVVVSWRALLPYAWGEAARATKGNPPHLIGVQSRLRAWGHDVDEKTIGKVLRKVGLKVSPQGVSIR